MLPRLRKTFIGLVAVAIVGCGFFRVWIQIAFAEFLIWTTSSLELNSEHFFELLISQAGQGSLSNQPIGWLIYYPSYLLLHLIFVVLLFRQPKTQKIVIMAIVFLVGTLFCGWLVSLAFELTELAEIFRIQFQNLFGLPFILLAIEGGRVFYQDMLRLTDNKDESKRLTVPK